MNREIKFRGYSTNLKKWMFGTYYYGVMYPTSFKGHYVDDELINDGTIGQFTGLKDKSGKEIYEGDILKFKTLHETEEIGFVTFDLGCFRLSKRDTYRGGYSEIRMWNDGSHEWYSIENIESFEIEVIGNILDNYELLAV